MKDLTIVVPAYNEQETLPSFLEGLSRFLEKEALQNVEAIVVNDGSKDNTKKILENFTNSKIKVLHHKVNRGYGGAIKTGIKNSNSKYVITIDADGQHKFEDVLNLFKLIKKEDADMIVGSRKLNNKQSLFRAFGKTIIRNFAKLLMPLNIYDINSGMKIYNTELAKKYIKLCPDSMAYSDIILLIFVYNRNLVLEEDIKIEPRQGGKSTINIKTAFQTIIEIIHIMIMFNPLRIFLPISIFLFLIGTLLGGYFIYLGRGLSVASSFLLISALLCFLLGLLAEQLAQIRKNM